jgi:hypothetical protein
MGTLAELISYQEVELENAEKTRQRGLQEIQTILGKARNEGRSTLSDEENADLEAAEARVERAKRDKDGINAKLKRARHAKSEEDEADAIANERRGDPDTMPSRKAAYDQVVRIGEEPKTYNPGNCRKGGLFLRDVVQHWVNRDLNAEARLTRHAREVEVDNAGKQTRAAGDAGTGAFTGLVVPQYLTEMYAPKTAAMRPLADIANSHDLPPDGMTVNISQITTASSVDLQASEFAEVSGTSMDDTLLTENIQTAAGFQDLSRQAIDRGTGIEDVTMDDLFRRYASRVDFTLINQASTGLSAVAQDNAAATATFAAIYPKFAQAQSQAETAYLGFATPGFAVMHPRRWHWLNAQLVSTWPALQQPGVPTQSSGVNLAQEYGKGARGMLPNGLVVIVDANVPINLGGGTNQDEIYIVAADELHLWEDPSQPTFIRAEQPRAKNMAVTLVLYGYFAYSFRRYANGMQKISGAGLVTPTF